MGLNQAKAAGALRFGLTPVFLDEQAGRLRHWRRYLERHLERPVSFVQRGSYREVIELLRDGRLDVAWICGYPYVRESAMLQLVVSPLYQQQPLYQSYLIVPHQDFSTQNLEDLQGRLFAYSDPDSLSGYLLPRHRLLELDYDPEQFFQRSIFTWTHRNSIRAVADQLVDAAAVDGYVWDMLEQAEPMTAGLTRVVCRSDPYGFPPIVARKSLDPNVTTALTEVLENMPDDPVGEEILQWLGLDGFRATDTHLYDDLRALVIRHEAA